MTTHLIPAFMAPPRFLRPARAIDFRKGGARSAETSGSRVARPSFSPCRIGLKVCRMVQEL
jgi:hypothetical protein